MKKLVCSFAVLLACTSGVYADPPGELTTIRAAASLTNAEASRHLPVSFEATVTYYRWYDKDLFVQDGDVAIYVHATTNLKLAPGDRVLVRGTTHESFRPYVQSIDITVVGHSGLPKPVTPSYEQMIRAEADCKLATVHALVLSANLIPNPRSNTLAIFLQLLVEGGHVDANVDSDDENALKGLLDSEVEITGVVSGHFDNKMQLTGILLHVPSMDGVKMLKSAGSDPWSMPATPMDQMIAGYRVRDLTERMRVQGIITYYQPGKTLVMQDGSKSIWIDTESYSPLRIGDEATAVGFPDVQNGFLTLTRSEVRDSSILAPVTPSLLTWRELALGGNNSASHIFELVSIEGRVVAQVRQATQDEYVLDTGGHLFSAILLHPGSFNQAPLPPMKQVPLGSRIRVSGICIQTDANPFNGEVPFNIMLRFPDDIVVVARPPWLNVHNLLLLAALLLLALFSAGVRSLIIERKMRQETAAAAYLERRRREILEYINNSRPLEEILEQISKTVSFKLHGAACWCEINKGVPLGSRPSKITSQRIIQQEIPGRSGAELGTIFAAINRRMRATADESVALAVGAGLATLAIETSRLYSDLVYRSEFDLLTDVQNRFALEKQLESLIAAARQSAAIFGIIYIDLDRFKQINDRYGHHVGDVYLQQAALRMKKQLRPGDALARLGGDEFAVVVRGILNRSEVEEIALRLERCFDEPFTLEDLVISGAASIGVALFPQDAGSADTLLRAADAAMYVMKQSRHDGTETPPA